MKAVSLLNAAALVPVLLLTTRQARTDGFVDPEVAKSQAISFERQMDWDRALGAWQSILDRWEPSEVLRFEAVGHVHDLNMRVKPANTSPRAAKAWPTLVVIFRNVNLDWKDKDGLTRHFHSHFTDPEIRSIHQAFDTFSAYVFQFSSGLLRIDPSFRIVDEPITRMEGTDASTGYWNGPGILNATYKRLLKGTDYQSVFSYEKFSEGKQQLPRAFAGGSLGGDCGLNGAAYSDILWDGGEGTDGEVELHEWLHQIDWMFTTVLKYPQAASISPDWGKRVGEEGGDTDFRRIPAAINWIDFYRN